MSNYFDQLLCCMCMVNSVVRAVGSWLSRCGVMCIDVEHPAGPVSGAYMCDRCGKSFGHESDLRCHLYASHSRRQSPVHACAWCTRQFSSSSHLASHERTHTGDKPFTCDSCGKQFTQSGSLNVHRRTHVDPQPFPCLVCGQRFASKQYARKHFTMRHSSTTPAAAAAP